MAKGRNNDAARLTKEMNKQSKMSCVRVAQLLHYKAPARIYLSLHSSADKLAVIPGKLFLVFVTD
jgi:hypothetical protein